MSTEKSVVDTKIEIKATASLQEEILQELEQEEDKLNKAKFAKAVKKCCGKKKCSPTD